MSLKPKSPPMATYPVKAIALLSNTGAGLMTIQDKFPKISQELISDCVLYDNALASDEAQTATRNEIVKLVRIIKSAVDVFEVDHRTAYHWFQNEKLAGFNKTPREIFLMGKSETVLTYIDRIDHTVYA